MSWRLDNRRKFILLGLAAAALLLQALLDQTRAPVRQRDYELKMAAAIKAERAFATVRRHRDLEDVDVDLVNDPAGTGLIGPEFSLITNARGDLEAKLTTLNPNFAGLMVQFFRQAGLSPGDPVAVALSGSFPGMNICVYAALETLELRPVIVTSVGASMWGGNDPQFTWLDMESLFFNEGVFHTRSAAATYGGGNDMGRGLSPGGRGLIQQAIDRNDVPLLASDNIEDAIIKRMGFYEQEVRGRPYRLYINVGGGVASIGSSHNRLLLPTGLNFDLGAHNWPRKGSLILFAEKGVPTVHLLGITDLAQAHGLPVAPDYLPQPGEGDIFVKQMYRFPLAAAALFVYCLACVLILAPEIRAGLFDRITRRRTPIRVLPLLVLVLLSASLVSADARAETKWLSVDPTHAEGSVCITSSGRDIEYEVLRTASATSYRINGPRRGKLVSRYLFGPGDPLTQSYTVTILVDGAEFLRRTFTVKRHETTVTCDQGPEVSPLERVYLSIGKGSHVVEVLAETTGSGEICARLFRESKRKSTRTVPYAPEQYLELATMQFESGSQSTYYRFEAGTPLVFAVSGPTDLEVRTRLDFDKTMNGSQNYSLEVLLDDSSWKVFHFSAEKLTTAFYPDQLDLLPGNRQKLKIPVPPGPHRFEIRCVRPEACGVAAQIRIPESDLEGRR